MQIRKLKVTSFRSWDKLNFEFRQGISVLEGSNGSGKSSIRMAAIYAVTGSIPNIKKSGLVKEDATSPFSTELTLFDSLSGKDIVIRRTSTRASVEVDGVSLGIRENSVLDRFKSSLAHTFLSPEQTSFIDLPNSKRKDMLEASIPELFILRGHCADKFKRISKALARNRNNCTIKVHGYASQAQALKETIALLERSIQEEKQRLEDLEKSLTVSLPYTEHEHQKHKESYDSLLEKRKKHVKFIKDVTAFLDNVEHRQALLSRDASALASVKKEYDVHKGKEASYVEMTDTLEDSSLCTSCSNPLVCKVCSAPVLEEDSPRNKALNQLAQIRSKLAILSKDLERFADNASKIAIPPDAEVSQRKEQLKQSRASVSSLEEDIQVLKDKIDHYVQEKAQIERVKSIANDESALRVLAANVKSTKAKIKTIDAFILAGQQRIESLTVLGDSYLKMATMSDKVIPTLYIEQFVKLLETNANFLLKHISNLKIMMLTTDKQIDISISGKDFHQLSSGERQRARIAIILAFSLMAKSTDTLFLDEVFDTHVDAEGIEDLAYLLRNVISSFYSKILIVTFKPELSALLNPDNHYVVTKEDGSSKLTTTITAG